MAREREGFRSGVAPLPNQYSGRYMRYWNCSLLFTLKKARLMKGKM